MASPLLLLLLLIPVVLVLLPILVLYLIIYPGPVKVPIKGRHVFVTGGSSGIGLAIAKRAAAEGAARVSILARDCARLEAARQEIIHAATGVCVDVYSVDVRDAAAVKVAIEAAGTIDVLVCNQGVFKPKPLVDQDIEEIQDQIGINLMGSINLVKAAIPGMKRAAAEDRTPRSIAFTTSEGGQVGVYGYAAYCAGNFAIRGFAEAMQMELISDNIHLSLILPTETDTPGRAAEVNSRPELSNIISSSSGEMMKPEDVAVIALDGIKAGKFTINVTFLGSVMSLATAGFSPQRSFLRAFAEVTFAGLMRFLALFYLGSWYNLIEKYNAKTKKEETHNQRSAEELRRALLNEV